MANRRQWIFVGLSILCVLILFFAFDTVKLDEGLSEMPGSFAIERAELERIIERAEVELTGDKSVYVRTMRNVAQGGGGDTTSITAMKKLSAFWFELGEYAAAGYWARMIAENLRDEESWGIAGSTFAYGITAYVDKERQQICLENAEVCFENAISLNPQNLDYRINLAICYVELPPENNPMRGIQSLLSLNEQYPENTSVLYHLARFGLRTGQVDRAIERLTAAIGYEPGEQRLYCLLAEAYRQQGNTTSEERNRRICEEE